MSLLKQFSVLCLVLVTIHTARAQLGSIDFSSLTRTLNLDRIDEPVANFTGKRSSNQAKEKDKQSMHRMQIEPCTNVFCVFVFLILFSSLRHPGCGHNDN